MDKWFYYVRISSNTGSKPQTTDRQIYSTELISFCERNKISKDNLIIMEEIQSGKDFDRPQYKLLKQVLSKSDNLIISSIDRFGRNYMTGRQEFAELLNMGVKVYVLNRPMLEDMYKLNDNMSKFMINFLIDWELMTAEEELKRIHERQQQGIQVCRDRGDLLGRPETVVPKNFQAVYDEWKTGSRTAISCMKEMNLKRTTFYKIAKNYENKNKNKY